MAGRYQEIFTPEMTVENPIYHFNVFGEITTLEGTDAVKGVYSEWTATAQCVFYSDGEKLAVSDSTIVSTTTIFQQTPGSILAAGGASVDPAAMYLVKGAQHMIWPYDNQGRLVGEDVWEYDERLREIIALEPSEVLIAEQACKLLAPLMKPLPAFNPFTA